MDELEKLQKERFELIKKLGTCKKNIKNLNKEIILINEQIRRAGLILDEYYYKKNLDPKGSNEFYDYLNYQKLKENYENAIYEIIGIKNDVEMELKRVNKEISLIKIRNSKSKKSTRKKDDEILKKIIKNIKQRKIETFSPTNIAKIIKESPATVWRKLNNYGFLLLLSGKLVNYKKELNEDDPCLNKLIYELSEKIETFNKKIKAKNKTVKEIPFSDLPEGKKRRFM